MPVHLVFVIYKAIVSFFGLNLNIKAKRVKAAELILMADKRQGQALFTCFSGGLVIIAYDYSFKITLELVTENSWESILVMTDKAEASLD